MYKEMIGVKANSRNLVKLWEIVLESRVVHVLVHAYVKLQKQRLGLQAAIICIYSRLTADNYLKNNITLWLNTQNWLIMDITSGQYLFVLEYALIIGPLQTYALL